jgi:hypothetical protein
VIEGDQETPRYLSYRNSGQDQLNSTPQRGSILSEGGDLAGTNKGKPTDDVDEDVQVDNGTSSDSDTPYQVFKAAQGIRGQLPETSGDPKPKVDPVAEDWETANLKGSASSGSEESPKDLMDQVRPSPDNATAHTATTMPQVAAGPDLEGTNLQGSVAIQSEDASVAADALLAAQLETRWR